MIELSGMQIMGKESSMPLRRDVSAAVAGTALSLGLVCAAALGTNAGASGRIRHPRLWRRHIYERLHHPARPACHQYGIDYADPQRTGLQSLQRPRANQQRLVD